MATRIQQTTKKAQSLAKKDPPRCLEHFDKGIHTCGQLAAGMSMLMSDLIAERVGTSIGNAVCNAGAKMLKAVEMQQRFGIAQKNGRKELALISAS
jgi:hypothetical protein